MNALSLAPVRVPPRELFTTREGLRCVVARRGQVPLVAVRLVLHGGSAADPPGREGVTDFMLRLLRRGTRRRSAEALDEAIEFVGGTLHAGSFEDYASLSLTAPVPHLRTLLNVLAELVQSPRFAPTEVKAARDRTLAELVNDLDDPGSLADRVLLRAIWGTHPYSHDVSGRVRSVRRFNRDAVQRFYRDRLGPRTVSLYVVGPVDAGPVRRVVERAFGGWRSEAAPPAPPPTVNRLANPGQIWVVDKPEQTQSQVRLANFGYARGAPYAHAVQVMNAAVGGGFTSRLVNEVRVNRGLSYGISSSLDPLRAGGTYLVGSFTKTESTRELIDVVLSVLRAVRDEGISDGELRHAQRYLSGTYPLRTETNEAMASALADVEFYGLGAEWIERYRERLHEVTREQVHAAAERILLAEPPTLVVVGQAQKVKQQLKGLGLIRLLRPGDDS
jgi:zinc protease